MPDTEHCVVVDLGAGLGPSLDIWQTALSLRHATVCQRNQVLQHIQPQHHITAPAPSLILLPGMTCQPLLRHCLPAQSAPVMHEAPASHHCASTFSGPASRLDNTASADLQHDDTRSLWLMLVQQDSLIQTALASHYLASTFFGPALTVQQPLTFRKPSKGKCRATAGMTNHVVSMLRWHCEAFLGFRLSRSLRMQVRRDRSQVVH